MLKFDIKLVAQILKVVIPILINMINDPEITI